MGKKHPENQGGGHAEAAYQEGGHDSRDQEKPQAEDDYPFSFRMLYHDLQQDTTKANIIQLL
jgi:hypothetical protein